MKFSNSAARSICEAVREAREVEVCGFLVGHITGEQIRVERARPVQNIYGSKLAFAVSEEEYKAVLSELNYPSIIVGLYHLHHGPPILSCTDRNNVLLHEFAWLIIGVSGRSEKLQWRCFKAKRGIIRRLAVEFDEEPVAAVGSRSRIRTTRKPRAGTNY